MPQNLVLREREEEYDEGAATYSQARMYQLMAEKGGLTPLDKDKDPQHHGFPNAKTDYERMISEIPPAQGPADHVLSLQIQARDGPVSPS